MKAQAPSAYPAWLLPSGFEDTLPARAEILETCRRGLLDLYAGWGYRQVIPPLVEHLESLLTGSAADLDLQTWKLVDQASGRLVGLRSDMTPQMARIDAQISADDETRRLCYAGTVLRARPDHLGGSRAPFQVGAELFGVAGPEADLEVLSLMVESLLHCRVGDLLLDLGHVGIAHALADAAGFHQDLRAELLRLLERKAWPDIRLWLDSKGCGTELMDDFATLLRAHGGLEVLERTQGQLGHHGAVRAALEQLLFIWTQLQQRYPQLQLQCDLAEVHGHQYHTGLLFSAYGPQQGAALASGGRYDGIGLAFGGSRPATGFSLDLKPILPPAREPSGVRTIWAPGGQGANLWQTITALRQQGQRVIQDFSAELAPADPSLVEEGYGSVLEKSGGKWHVRPLTSADITIEEDAE
ncbi:MAG: ATP phosphoribosyltransferase regulatory subunit [Gammaproteobacteria bacterium]|nr:ATP phosphoribosyltransferase regulatory subunit [Gammaproteobacteria bacterium]